MSGFQAGQVTQLPLKRVFINAGSCNQKSNRPCIHGENTHFSLMSQFRLPTWYGDFCQAVFAFLLEV